MRAPKPIAPTISHRLRRWRHRLGSRLLAALNLGLFHFLGCLPIEWCSAIGAFLGDANGRTRHRSGRDAAARGYRRLSPVAVTEAEADAAASRLFLQIGRVMCEFAVLHRLWPSGRISVAGTENLQAALQAGPTIVVGLHLGNWETIAPAVMGLGVQDLLAFYQPPPSSTDEKIAVTARQRYGVRLLRPTIAATRQALRHLVQDRGTLLIYADDEREGRVLAPLFGRPIPQRSNIVNIVRYAWASGATVIPAYAERLVGARFRVTFRPPVALAPKGDDEATALSDNVHRIDQIIAPLVLSRLDQWYMLVYHG
jgi:Kdo2-lipid IVA lauroyltransferase/acyltransferase